MRFKKNTCIFWGVLHILLFSFLTVKGQLTVNNTLTPTQLVQNVLLGTGITASNITYNGVPVAIGDFNGSSSNIGLAGGVIMSSGNISNAVGPNNTGGASVGNGLPGDPDLDQIMAPTFSYDATILEFDFVPVSDSVKFKYVFGSEEYMEFVSPFPGGINDGFGFFISGPGITGTFTNNARNIALIPGTALPVTMFNLNLNSNGAYYFDNGDGFGSGTAPDGTSVQYDGFTVPLEAVCAVQCGQTYHIKLAIADGGDGVLDSGVFLEAGSFSSIGKPEAGPDISINVGSGCTRQILAKNFNVSTVTWTSIFPGATGAYNSYLSCTSGCLNPTVSAPLSAPAYVDYRLCGTSLTCNPSTVCDTVRVSFNPPLQVIATPQNPVLCPGQSSVTLTATPSGGSPPIAFLWNNINPSQSITVGSGNYTVEVTDESTCPSVFATVTVTSYSVSPTANAGADKTVCSQNPITTLNGSISGANGGTWSGGTGTFSPDASTVSGVSYTPSSADLAAGFVDLTLTTTGTGSCAPAADVVRITYTDFTETITFSTTPVSCFGGNNGTAAVVLLPASTPPYSYSWSTAPAQSSPTATNLMPGQYSVTVTNGIGCTATSSVAVIQPNPLAVASVLSDAICSGDNNGSINLTVSGGNAPYTYSWSNGATTPGLSNLTAQTYSVTVTDVTNCTTSQSYVISEPSPLNIVVNATDVSCFGGSDGGANSVVNGGKQPYSYSWSSGASSPNTSGLPAGTYTLTVTDASLCTATATVVINEPAAPLSVVVSATNITCNGAGNGSASAVASGGTAGYTYLWQPGAQTSASVNNLTSGTYSLTVTDQKGCTTNGFVTVTEPSPLNVSFVSQKNVSCKNGNDGTVSASVLGGTPAYSFSWSNGAVTPQISNLTAQTYTVSITDNSGCTATNSVTITEPAAFVGIAVSSTNVSCFGVMDGSVSSTPSGGTAPYSYIWLPGSMTTQNVPNLGAGTYTVTVRDTLGCQATNSATISQPSQLVLVTTSVNADCGVPNGQTSVAVTGGSGPYTYQWTPAGGTDSVATGLFSGAYNVTVTDMIGCTASQFGNISENSSSAASVFSTVNISCNGGSDGSITAGTMGAGGPYTYLWTPSGGTDSVATGLTAGTYTITITDQLGCKSLATATLTEPAAISIAATTTSVSCYGGTNGSATATVSGGTPGYTYLWTPGGATGASMNNVSANTYTVQVTDTNSCVQMLPVTVTQPLQLITTSDSIHNISCFGGSDGAIRITSSGGTPVYYYSWLPTAGNGTMETNLAAGTYTITTTDFTGCTITTNITITEPAQPLSATRNVSAPSCFGASTGTIGINVSGGTPGYSYLWTPSVSVSDTASGLPAGAYTILVSDTNNCQANLSVDILQSTAITGTLTASDPSCGLSNGSLTAQVSGGVAPYSYLWTPGSTTNASISNIGPGTYNLLITDATNCTLNLSTTLNDSSPVITVSSIIDVSCYSGSDGAATIAVTQGASPYTINWTPAGGNALNASSLTAGSYTVSVTDATGCQVNDTLTVAEPAQMNVTIASQTDVLCNGDSTGSITAAVTGGTGPTYTYLWTPSGAVAATATNLSTGTHTVTVTDQNGCTSAISASVSEPAVLLSAIDTTIFPVCFGGFGRATVSATGGVLPYTYLWPTSGETGVNADSLTAGSHTVTITDANGCTTTSTAIITEPSQVITTPGSNDTLCPGQSTTLSATAGGGAGNYYYAWQPSGAITNGTLNITPTGNITYTVVAYDQIGCPGTPATVSAIVYSLDSTNIKAYATSPVCLGQSASVYVETYGPTGPLTYQWNNSLGNGPGLYTVSPTQNTTYVVTVSNSCGLSINDSETVYITLPPTVEFYSDSNIVCAPGPVIFTDSSDVANPNDPIVSWLWNFGDGTSDTTQNPVHFYNQQGNYLVSLTITTEDGCTNNSAATPMTITGIPAPSAVFSMNATTIELPNEALILSNQSTGASSYMWSFGDGGVSTDTAPQYAYSMVGTFQVQLIAIAQNGCQDTAYALLNVDADVIFPNVFTPNLDGSSGGAYNANDLTNDVFFPYTTGVTEYTIEIYNRWGELIFQSDDILKGWDGYYKGFLCQQDVYIYKAYIKLNNGKEFNKNGSLTLLW
ncbi:MAG: choice-of-anchor L domain-containing protein [Bacteroidia bacterium]